MDVCGLWTYGDDELTVIMNFYGGYQLSDYELGGYVFSVVNLRECELTVIMTLQ